MYSYYMLTAMPRLPAEISGLSTLAYNFWFSWQDRARHLFMNIDPELWSRVHHNPVLFLQTVAEEKIHRAAASPEYLRQYHRVWEEFQRYMEKKDTWYSRHYPDLAGLPVAYFSAEFGLHESYPIYSGGLGLLAGDHLKAASDLGLPFAGVGLLYKHGYFTQRINRENRQEATYPENNFCQLPMRPAVRPDGSEVFVQVQVAERTVFARVWEVQVGRVKIYLLDSDVPRNRTEDRLITGQLYGGNRDTRIMQEILLGIGGVRALRELGVQPAVYHINEGHSAFLTLELLREKVARGLEAPVAIQAVRAGTVFTTHTPVPAGHDYFSAEMMDYYLGYLPPELKMSRDELLMLGWDNEAGAFNMTLLALRMSDYCNGVSRLHGAVSRAMFRRFFGHVPAEEVPVDHITNGVHLTTWMAPEMQELLGRYLGPGWQERIDDPALWEKVQEIPDEQLWQVHCHLKERFIAYVRRKVKQNRVRNLAPAAALREAEEVLSPSALTIGFARRFATYKRAGLIFRDKERLARLLNNPERPVQIVFAGKAHPADYPGQELIKMVCDIAGEEPFRGKIVFLENYDIDVARQMLRGVDVWLNNPRRPQEASGTSGMKAALNGLLNCSILDGWWPEAYNGQNGFAIGSEEEFSSEEAQDLQDALSLYSVLENQIIPLYFNREQQIPRGWIQYMKNSLRSIAPYFNTLRMVKEYTTRYYVPAINRSEKLARDQYRLAGQLVSFQEYMRSHWYQVEVRAVEVGAEKGRQLAAGDTLPVSALIKLGEIKPDDVQVELVWGRLKDNCLVPGSTQPMQQQAALGEGVYRYTGILEVPPGVIGFTVRVRPRHPEFVHKFQLPLVTWLQKPLS
ncbi:alpha-glucan family phosphorylase [Desulfurispora thermophila]|uniref:alpha-glucan family phosphorylase n=1 Tax=Desulfurispora thermophila TaxID=265470 RepID=UPI0003670BEF|nr:alpha-glucan family phosphorylase [Desulfurispora thermophila]